MLLYLRPKTANFHHNKSISTERLRFAWVVFICCEGMAVPRMRVTQFTHFFIFPKQINNLKSNNMKRILLFLSALVITFSLLAYNVEVNGIYYNLDRTNKTAQVISVVNKNSENIIITKTITYDSETYSVTSIGQGAFSNCTGLISITIPNSVTSIGEYAFSNCNLTKVNYLGTVDEWVSIDFLGYKSNPATYAEDFYINDKLLTDVKITSADSIKQRAFESCKSLTSVTIGNNVTFIDDLAFLTCRDLTEIIVLSNNKNFTSDNGVLFNKDKTKLIQYPIGKNSTTYEIPNYVTSIGKAAFTECMNLTSVIIPNSVKYIRDWAFSSCGYLAKVNYLGTVDEWAEIDFGSGGANPTDYANDLYINGDLLTDVKITSADSIKQYAFYNCKSIKSVEIGNNVKFIGYGAFGGCDSLTKVNYLGTLEEYMEGNFGKANNTILDLYIKGELLTDLKITSADSIKDYAFYNCQSIKSVEIGNSVNYIGESAFDRCTGLTKVNYLGTVDKWAKIDFKNSCSNPTYYTNDLYINDKLLTDVIITSTDSIRDYAFYNCKSIKSIEIGNSVKYIGQGAFYGCSALTSVTIPGSVASIGSSAFCGCSGLTSLSICEGVKEIQNQAFLHCSELISINIPNSVNIICENVFRGTSFYNDGSNWDNGVLYIDNCLISTKKDVIKGSYTIKEGTRLISGEAFRKCSGLTSLTIPNSVTSIGSRAFYDCSGLTKVNYLGTVDEWVEIDMSDNLTYYAKDLYINDELLTDVKITSADSIKNYAFYNCASIKSVEIGNCVKYIGFHAFLNCSGLSSVTLPNSVTSIGDGAFARCSGLTEVTIPNSVTSIGESVFYNCSGLTSIIIPNSITYIDYDAFGFCDSLKTVYNCSSLDIVKGSYTNGSVAYYADEVINACPVGDFIVNYEDEIIEYIGDTTVNKIEIPEFVTGIESDVFASCANIDTIVWNAINCADFTEKTAPFNAQAAQIKSVIFGNNVEYIPAYLCSDMTLLTEISIPGKVNSIGENAFKGCSRLKFITSYPTLVPLAKENSFNSYSAYLYILCDYYDYYYLDDVFGKFTEIKCISAEEVEGSEKVEIEVDSNNNATIIWPSTGNASSYELVISKNGEVFCTLLFNENGQLTSIDFGNRSASVGFQFTVTGLDAASKYSYSIVAKDEKGNELESYNGTFTTNGYSEVTAILETLADANITISGGTISADADFTIYNTLGQDVTNLNGALTPGVYVVQVVDDFVKVMVK